MTTFTRQPGTPPQHEPQVASRDVRLAVRGLLHRLRGRWRRVVLVRGIVAAAALLSASALVLLAADLLVPLPADARTVLRLLPLLLALAAVGVTAYRLLRPPSDRRLALLAEERAPGLGNALATALDLDDADGGSPVRRAFVGDVSRRLATVEPHVVAPLRIGTPMMVVGVSLALLAAFALAFPAQAREAWSRWSEPRDAYAGDWREARARVLPTVPEPPVPGFDELRWRITPPAYSGLATVEGRGDDALSALPGSRVRLRSRYAPRWSAVRAARVDGGAIPVVRRDGEWVAEWTVGADDRGVVVEAAANERVVDRRVVPVLVLPDRAPDVTLSVPERDLVLPSANGRLAIRASATDDYGVAELRLTWIRSRGSGEMFEFAEGEWPWTTLRRSAKGAEGAHVVDLATLGLQPGDVVHLRAVARDRNDVTGPGESVSRTRIVRIARENELDQVDAVLSLPPEMPKDPVLSQRMLVLLTERLRDRAPSLSRAALVEESGHLGYEQGRLRERVGEQIFTRNTAGVQGPDAQVVFEDQEGAAGHAHGAEEGHAGEGESLLERASEATGQGTMDEVAHKHDESAIIDVNRDLLTLYNLMWAAERELNQGAPSPSLPHQRRALELIQRLRTAERVFARGQVRVDPVDVAEARGEGKVDEAAPVARSRSAALPSAGPLLAELDRAMARLGAGDGRDAALGLSTLAARALGDSAADRQAATLLSRAASAAARGRVDEARELARRARGRLSPSTSRETPPLPSTADPAAAEYFRRLGRGGG